MPETDILYMDPEHIDQRQIDIAASAIRKDKVIAFPTETVYGLGCSTESEVAARKIFEIKRRSRYKPFAICLKSVDDLAVYRPELTESAEKIIQSFLPGPLTVILRCESGRILGFRIPDCEITRRLILAADVPLFSTSANISDGKNPTTAKQVLEMFKDRIDVLIDAGPSRIGLPSTVVDLTDNRPVLIREGAIPASKIEEAINTELLNKL